MCLNLRGVEGAVSELEFACLKVALPVVCLCLRRGVVLFVSVHGVGWLR